MPRQLKTYVTSLGFFELAVAAPSMKAALEAWGSERNLFHQGFARETDDPAIVAAAMAQPGVILKRAVGSRDVFREDAELPTSLAAGKPRQAPSKPRPKMQAKGSKSKASAKIFSLVEARAAKQAAAAVEREQVRREAEEHKEDAARARERAQRDAAAARAEAAMEKARRRHDKIIREIETAREALERRIDVEDARWTNEKDKLEEKTRRAKE